MTASLCASKKILVTGGAGFIGSHTVDLLLSLGHQVTVLDNLASGKLENLNLNHQNLAFIEGDVLEYPLVCELIEDCDCVLHLAAIASVPLSIEDPIYTFQVNTQGFLHVILAVQKAKRPIRLVYASSASVYGDSSSLPSLDDVPLSGEPLSPYALQKIHAEHYADLFARLYGTQSLGLRYFNVYGSRQDPASPYSGVISRFLDAYQKGEALTIFGNGEQSRDFIYIKDVALANSLALNSQVQGILNIATGISETLLKLVQYIEAAEGRPQTVRFEPRRKGDIQSSLGSIKKAQQQLAFNYATSLKEGIASMIKT